MKPIKLLIIPFLLLAAFGINAQTKISYERILDFQSEEIKPNDRFGSLKKSANEDIFVLDSVLHEMYNYQWDTIFYINDYYKYNLKGDRIEWMRLGGCSGCAVGGNFKFTYTFIEDKNSLITIFYDWDPVISEWVVYSKEERIYGTGGNDSGYTFFRYDTLSMEWNFFSKVEYTYDANGNLITELQYSWNENLDKWDSTRKKEWGFNQNGKLVLYTEYKYNLENESWIPYSKGDYLYDITANDSVQMYFDWDLEEQTWNLYGKTEFIVDGSGKNGGFSVFSKDTSGQWIGNNKELYFYDANGSLILEEYFDWNLTNFDWVFRAKIEREFSSINQLTDELTYHWDKTQNEWNFNTKRTLAYDVNNNLETDIYYEWIGNDTWQLDDSYTYFYSEFTTNISNYLPELQTIEVYPNPANESFTIKVLNTKINTAQLFSSTGKLLKTLPLEIGINSYNVSDLKNGIYFIQLSQNEGTVVKKLVKY